MHFDTRADRTSWFMHPQCYDSFTPTETDTNFETDTEKVFMDVNGLDLVLWRV